MSKTEVKKAFALPSWQRNPIQRCRDVCPRNMLQPFVNLSEDRSKTDENASMKTFFLYVMGLFFVAAGGNHFYMTRLYCSIIPPYLRSPGWLPVFLVWFSGGAEMSLGALLLWPPTRKFAAWGIVALLIAVFPANYYMFQARDSVFSSIPAWILILRLPLQLGLTAWAYLYTR